MIDRKALLEQIARLVWRNHEEAEAAEILRMLGIAPQSSVLTIVEALGTDLEETYREGTAGDFE